MQPEEGGAGIGVYTRAYGGYRVIAEDLRVLEQVWRSSKGPEGLTLEGKSFVHCHGFSQGGHYTEKQMVKPGLAAHNRRGRSYTFHEGDVEWTHLVYIVGWDSKNEVLEID